ncbi:MAG: DUF3307 domain-containing protein [Rhizobiaceae bacterium]
MPSVDLLLIALVLLQAKHFIADYLLQPGWMLRGKNSFAKIGGYAHAGIHASLSLPVLLQFGLQPLTAAWLCAAEFCTHYLIDYGKSNLPFSASLDVKSRTYWALHGGDQLLHHLTYVALLLGAGNLLPQS